MRIQDPVTRRRFLLGSCFAAASGLGALSWSQGGFVHDGPRAPELVGGPDDWVNTNGQALHLYGPGGLLAENAAVLIDFWEYTCVNCIRTLPYLRAWNDRYRGKGLTIIGIHTPEFAFARQKANVAAAARQFGLTYPILVDSRYANWNAYQNQFWPRHYLIDRHGWIVDDHAGEGGYGDSEQHIQQTLRATHPFERLPAILEPLRGSDKPGAVCYRQTPEIYVGFERGAEQFGSPQRPRPSMAARYTDPPDHQDGRFYASGLWRALPESLRHARATDNPFGDYVVLRYMALEANAVIKPEGGKPFDLYILQDGKPVAREDKGDDLLYSADGRSYVHVDAPRMFQLAHNHIWGQHELRLGSTSPDFGLYSLTFTSCEMRGKS